METEKLYKEFIKSNGIATDSRVIKPGQIFFALWGENYNGNDYAHDALEKGASLAVIDDPLFETDKTILVDDSLMELHALSLHHRKLMNIPVLGITGTNGKTTTKELLASVLSLKFKVHATKGNLNNHIGVPLTILSAPADTDFLIIEMGANHIGEISSLCRIANPNYGLITNIGTAHLEGFGSEEGVFIAKTELYDHLQKINGVAFYNDENHLLAEKIFRDINRAVPYSDPYGIDLSVEILSSELNLILLVDYNHQKYNLSTNLFGRYNLENIKAAIAIGLFFEIDIEKILNAIREYVPFNNRSQVRITESNTLICDSYNANPTSMLSALDAFLDLTSETKIVILGDMLELGEESEKEHRRLVDKLMLENIHNTYLVGPIFSKVSKSTPFTTFADISEIIEYLEANPLHGSTILIKGSRGIGLEKLYESL